jgi:hypothetical protein
VPKRVLPLFEAQWLGLCASLRSVHIFLLTNEVLEKWQVAHGGDGD